jgi:hypothetical protein
MQKKLLLLFVYLFLSRGLCLAQLQSTWVKTLFYQLIPVAGQTQDSLQIGPQKIVMASNQTYFVLNKDFPGYYQSIYHIDSLGHIISTLSGVGTATVSTNTIASNLYATSDSGCIYLETYIAVYPDYTLYKISKTGVRSIIHKWINSFANIQYVDTVIPNHHNGYYCRINSSFYDYPSNNPISGSVQCVFNNDDYLVIDSLLKRKDVSGNVIWSTLPGRVIANSEVSIYLATDSLVKVDAVTGAKLWTKPLPPGNQFDMMRSTDGLISLDYRTIHILDSSGTAADSNTIDLVYTRASTVASGNDGSIFTGGEFVNHLSYQNIYNYSSFLIKLNQEAKGVVDSTEFYLAGDADHDNDVKYIKDGLFIAAAIGQTTSLNQLNENTEPKNTTYSELWPNETACAINYRYSDCVMDGTITSADIPFLDSYQNYNATSINDTTGSLVQVLFDNNVVLPGDTIRASVILGSNIKPTDSICGFSIEPLLSGGMGLANTFVIDYKNGVLGDTSVNLNVFSSNMNFQHLNYGIIFCRNDHQNVSIAGDTLFRISAVLSPFTATGFYRFPSPCFAIKANGCFSPLNVINDTISVVVTATENLDENKSLRIFPNPSNEELNIRSSNLFLDKIKIINTSGQVVFERTINDQSLNLKTNDFPSGLYLIEIISEKTIQFRKIIIHH